MAQSFSYSNVWWMPQKELWIKPVGTVISPQHTYFVDFFWRFIFNQMYFGNIGLVEANGNHLF